MPHFDLSQLDDILKPSRGNESIRVIACGLKSDDITKLKILHLMDGKNILPKYNWQK